MKTTIESIMVQNDHGIVPVRIRMPNGDLKRRFLRSMLENGSVLPQVVVNKILLEILRELDSVYRTRRVYMDTALELKGVVDAINEKWHSDVEVHEAENADLVIFDDQIQIKSVIIGGQLKV